MYMNPCMSRHVYLCAHPQPCASHLYSESAVAPQCLHVLVSFLFCSCTQVAVGDVDSDGVTDIIVGDESGNIQCLDVKGTMKWEKSVDAPVSGGLRLADLEGNERMDVVMVTQDG